MNLKSEARRVARQLKKLGKLKLPVRATLAKAHVRGQLFSQKLESMGGIFQGKVGCECCGQEDLFLLNNVLVRIGFGRLVF